MKSSCTQDFWTMYARLPKQIQRQARKTYKTFMTVQQTPGLHLKRIHSAREIYSIRITRNYRALGILENDEFIWFWIGSHTQYEQHLKKNIRTNG